MLDLSSTTLVCADCVDANRAVRVLNRCMQHATFGAVKFLTSLKTSFPYAAPIPHLASLEAYSVFMLTHLHRHISTPHMLVVQRDGYIINPDKWNPDWLNYAYIGPLFNQYDIVGSGGFSFRSKAAMGAIAGWLPDWDGTPQSAARIQRGLGLYEDGIVSMRLRSQLEDKGFRFPSAETASLFAAGGNRNEDYYVERPFGFHAGTYYEKIKPWLDTHGPGGETDDGVVPRFPAQ
jgi:hypothetical protein